MEENKRILRFERAARIWQEENLRSCRRTLHESSSLLNHATSLPAAHKNASPRKEKRRKVTNSLFSSYRHSLFGLLVEV